MPLHSQFLIQRLRVRPPVMKREPSPIEHIELLLLPWGLPDPKLVSLLPAIELVGRLEPEGGVVANFPEIK